MVVSRQRASASVFRRINEDFNEQPATAARVSEQIVIARTTLGGTNLQVSSICLGGSPLGGMAQLYGHETEAAEAVATVSRAFDSPINFIDTSNAYSDGESERRIGEAIALRGSLPDDFVLATKVDSDPVTGEYSATRVRESVRESADRLGIAKFQLLYLHDPEQVAFEDVMAAGGPARELLRLKDEGLVENIGVAGGPIDEMLRYARSGIFDVMLTHNRYSLLDRSAEPLIDFAARSGIGVVNAAPYGGGMLAKGPTVQARYAYGMGNDAQTKAAGLMARACEEAGVSLAAAALQFSLKDKRIASTVVGVSSPSRIDQTIQLTDENIPDGLWAELDSLAPPPSCWIA